MTTPPDRRAPIPDDTARDRLLAVRADAVARLRALRAEVAGIVEASRDSNADDEHDPDGATIAFERAQVDALARDAAARSALRRATASARTASRRSRAVSSGMGARRSGGVVISLPSTSRRG